MIARNVRLFLDDAQWECTLRRARSASMPRPRSIAARSARTIEEASLPTHDGRSGTIAYRFAARPGGLALERGIRAGDALHPFEATLAALSVGTRPGAAVHRAPGRSRGGAGAGHAPARARAPRDRREAPAGPRRLRGRLARRRAGPRRPRRRSGRAWRSTEQGDGFRVALEDDPEISEVFGERHRAMRRHAQAHAGAEADRAGAARVSATGRHFGPESWNEPGHGGPSGASRTGRRRPAHVAASRPSSASRRASPVETRREGEALYASSPCSSTAIRRRRAVDGGKLVHLPGLAAAARRARGAARGAPSLGARLGLAPGVPAVVTGADAVDARRRSFGPLGRRGPRRPAGSTSRSKRGSRPSVRVRDDGRRGRPRCDRGAGRAGARRRRTPRAVLCGVPRRRVAGPARRRRLRAASRSIGSPRFGARIADLLAARDEAGAVPNALLPDVARLCDDLEQPRPPSFAGARRRCSPGSTGCGSPRFPADLTAELRPYQRRGVAWLGFLRRAGMGALLADDMGSGRRSRRCAPCPAGRWSSRPRASCTTGRTRSGASARRSRPASTTAPSARSIPRADVTITSYALLRLDEPSLCGRRVGHRGPRRGADDQEPREPGRAGRLPAQGGWRAHACRERPSRTGSTSCGARCTS
mgnify:CR=1 FL=1